MFYVSIVYEQGIGNLKMDEEFKSFLLKKKISEEKYDGMTGELQFKWSELFEKSKPQGKLFVHYSLYYWYFNNDVFPRLSSLRNYYISSSLLFLVLLLIQSYHHIFYVMFFLIKNGTNFIY